MLSDLKDFFKKNEADIVLVLGIVLIALISFGVGYLLGSKNLSLSNDLSSIEDAQEIRIEEPEEIKKEESVVEVKQEAPSFEPVVETQSQETSVAPANTSGCNYVGSKNSDVYHLPECPGALRIKEENLRCFSSKEEAEAAGYRPAKNCPGL